MCARSERSIRFLAVTMDQFAPRCTDPRPTILVGTAALYDAGTPLGQRGEQVFVRLELRREALRWSILPAGVVDSTKAVESSLNLKAESESQRQTAVEVRCHHYHQIHIAT